MDGAEIGVVAGSVAALGGVAWWFFSSEKPRAVARSSGGVQTFQVRVEGGYDPATLEAVAGVPLRIEFFRAENDSCSETVVFGDFGVSKKLQPFKTTVVEFTPDRAGTFGFQCGMGMLHGTLVVREGVAK